MEKMDAGDKQRYTIFVKHNFVSSLYVRTTYIKKNF